MINSIDLRINNILEYSGDYFKVKSISNSIIGADRNKGVVEFKPSELNPIPLTEEILLKVGFVEDEPYLELEISPGYGIQYYQYKTDKNKISIYSGTTVISNHCKYLHQLQNLYFSLTGGDLDTSRLL